jgi:hypothetical protein
MNRKILTKKYKNKRNRKTRKSRKNKKTRRRVLNGGMPPTSRRVVTTSRSVRPSSDIRSSRASIRAAISKPLPIPHIHICCQQISVVNQQKILSSINNFPMELYYLIFLV